MLISSKLEQKLFHCSLQLGGDKKFPMKYVEQELSGRCVRNPQKNHNRDDSSLTFPIDKLSHLLLDFLS